MNELSPQARALLARTASADDPTDADRARVLGLIGTAIAVPPIFDAGASAGAGAGAAAGGGTLKLVIAFVVSVGVGGGLTTVAARRAVPPPAPAVVVAAPPVQTASPRADAPDPVVVSEPAPEPVAPVAVERRPPPLPPPAVPKPLPPPATPEVPSGAPRPPVVRDEACELSAELAVLQRAQRALGGTPGEAVGVLDAFAARCANGALVEERLATRALALCLDGKAAEGKAAAHELADRFPASPSLSRVTQTCGQ